MKPAGFADCITKPFNPNKTDAVMFKVMNLDSSARYFKFIEDYLFFKLPPELSPFVINDIKENMDTRIRNTINEGILKLIIDVSGLEEVGEEAIEVVGEFAESNNIRLTSHPGPFNKLCSPKERVVENTLKDLEIHGKLFDMIGLSRTAFNKINIHVGAAYDSKETALDTFCKNFERLSESVRSRLTVENDDRPSLYSTHELYDGVYKRIGIPIVFDYHHHKFRNDGESEREALTLSSKTWGDVKQVVHYSE